MLEPYYVQLCSHKQLLGQFNSILAHRCLIFLDEVGVAPTGQLWVAGVVRVEGPVCFKLGLPSTTHTAVVHQGMHNCNKEVVQKGVALALPPSVASFRTCAVVHSLAHLYSVGGTEQKFENTCRRTHILLGS